MPTKKKKKPKEAPQPITLTLEKGQIKTILGTLDLLIDRLLDENEIRAARRVTMLKNEIADQAGMEGKKSLLAGVEFTQS